MVEKITPPGMSIDISTPSEAPGPHAGSFLIESSNQSQLHLLSPSDELTGLPLPIMPRVEDDTAYADWHHHFHPRRSSSLKNTGGQALRNARLQYTNRHIHDAYHHYYAGPSLPRSNKDKFALTIMAVAGYMPEFAIDFRADGPRINRMSVEDRQSLQLGGDMRLGSSSAVNKFIREYVLSRKLKDLNVNEIVIEEFITTYNIERRRELGHILLARFTDLAVEPIRETYNVARKKQLILPGLAKGLRRFAKARLGTPNVRTKLVDQLHTQLAA